MQKFHKFTFTTPSKVETITWVADKIINCPDHTHREYSLAVYGVAHLAYNVLPGFNGKITGTTTIRERINAPDNLVATNGMWHTLFFIDEEGQPFRGVRGFSWQNDIALNTSITERNVYIDKSQVQCHSLPDTKGIEIPEEINSFVQKKHKVEHVQTDAQAEEKKVPRKVVKRARKAAQVPSDAECHMNKEQA